jgi:hypothetical protein
VIGVLWQCNLILYISNTDPGLVRNRNWFFVFFCGVHVAHIFRFFCVVLLCVFTFLIPCCDVHYDFRIKTIIDRLHLQLFVGGFMPYLCYLCLFAFSGVQHILCCVFCFACLRLVSCVLNVVSFSGLSILDLSLLLTFI